MTCVCGGHAGVWFFDDANIEPHTGVLTGCLRHVFAATVFVTNVFAANVFAANVFAANVFAANVFGGSGLEVVDVGCVKGVADIFGLTL